MCRTGCLVSICDKQNKTKQLNHYCKRNISVLPAAISDKNSIAKLCIAERGRASNALLEAKGRSQMGGVREINLVPTFTLDTLLTSFDKPNFVKIDIEGAELLAIEGATNLIKNVRPIFYIEVGREHSREIFKCFIDNGYKTCDFEGNKVKPGKYANVFFIPLDEKPLLRINTPI